MSTSNEIVVDLSSKKIIVLLIASIAFVALGVFFMTFSTEEIEQFGDGNNPILFYGAGVVAIAFFGFCSVILYKKLRNHEPGLVLNDQGITDRSSGVAVGLIPWSDVSGIGQYQLKRQKFVTVQVKDPNKYASRGNAVQRLTHKANQKMTGTPINISATALAVEHSELLNLVESAFAESQIGENAETE